MLHTFNKQKDSESSACFYYCTVFSHGVKEKIPGEDPILLRLKLSYIVANSSRFSFCIGVSCVLIV